MTESQTSPSSQRALILESFTSPVQLSTNYPVPSPTAGSVLVKVLATPVLPYMSEVLTNSRPYPVPLPFVPGPGAIGRVHAVGPDATRLTPGQLVFADAYIKARDDPALNFLQGLHSGYSDATQRLAKDVWRDGAWAEYVCVPLESVFPIDESVLASSRNDPKAGYTPAELLGIFSVIVPYAGLADAGVKTGDTVIIAPSSGLFGSSAVAVALALGARVIACGRNIETLQTLPSRFGAPSSRLVPVQLSGDIDTDLAALRVAIGPNGADVFQDWCPPTMGPSSIKEEGSSPAHITTCILALRRGGTVSLTGGIRGHVRIPYGTVMHNNIRILGRFMYEREHTVQLIKMVESGTLKLGGGAGLPVYREFPLESVEAALKAAQEDFGQNGIVALTPV